MPKRNERAEVARATKTNNAEVIMTEKSRADLAKQRDVELHELEEEFFSSFVTEMKTIAGAMVKGALKRGELAYKAEKLGDEYFTRFKANVVKRCGDVAPARMSNATFYRDLTLYKSRRDGYLKRLEGVLKTKGQELPVAIGSQLQLDALTEEYQAKGKTVEEMVASLPAVFARIETVSADTLRDVRRTFTGKTKQTKKPQQTVPITPDAPAATTNPPQPLAAPTDTPEPPPADELATDPEAETKAIAKTKYHTELSLQFRKSTAERVAAEATNEGTADYNEYEKLANPDEPESELETKITDRCSQLLAEPLATLNAEFGIDGYSFGFRSMTAASSN